jgi:hypothetical protein
VAAAAHQSNAAICARRQDGRSRLARYWTSDLSSSVEAKRVPLELTLNEVGSCPAHPCSGAARHGKSGSVG